MALEGTGLAPHDGSPPGREGPAGHSSSPGRSLPRISWRRCSCYRRRSPRFCGGKLRIVLKDVREREVLNLWIWVLPYVQQPF